MLGKETLMIFEIPSSVEEKDLKDFANAARDGWNDHAKGVELKAFSENVSKVYSDGYTHGYKFSEENNTNKLSLDNFEFFGEVIPFCKKSQEEQEAFLKKVEDTIKSLASTPDLRFTVLITDVFESRTFVFSPGSSSSEIIKDLKNGIKAVKSPPMKGHFN